MSTFTSSTPRSKRAIVEKERRDVINGKVEMLRELLIDYITTNKISQGELLNRTAFLLNGGDFNAPMSPALSFSESDTPSSSPGPIRYRKEVLKDREQGRRDLQVAGFDALRKFVIDNGLSKDGFMERSVLLDIVIEQVKKIVSADPAKSVVSPTPIVSSSPLTIDLPALSGAPIIVPTLAYPFFNFYQLLYLQQILNFQKSLNETATDEEYIDIIN